MEHKQSNNWPQIVGRALVVWGVIIAAEFLHGILRVAFLEPYVGDFCARQIAVFTGAAIILVITLCFVRWLKAVRVGQLIGVGILWFCLTLAFELALGRVIMGYTWERLLEDYNVLRGGLLAFGMIILTLAPLLAAKLRAVIYNSVNRNQAASAP
jgi:hypothetical protein